MKLTEFLHLKGTLMEHFLEGITPLRQLVHPLELIHQSLNGTLPF